MADNVRWFKVMNEMFADEKIEYIETLPDADAILIIWIKTLCLASKSNNSGYLMLTMEMPYTYDLLASKFKKTIKQIEYAYCLMSKLGMIVIEDEIIKISNWAKYQNITALDTIREYERDRKRSQRQEQKLLKNNVPQMSGTNVPNLSISISNSNSNSNSLIKTKNKNKELKQKTKNKEEELKEIFDSMIDNYTENIELKYELKKHIEMRIGKNKVPTPRAVELILKSLDKFADSEEEKILIVQKAIVNCWTDVYQLHDKEKEQLANNQKENIEQHFVENKKVSSTLTAEEAAMTQEELIEYAVRKFG